MLRSDPVSAAVRTMVGITSQSYQMRNHQPDETNCTRRGYSEGG